MARFTFTLVAFVIALVGFPQNREADSLEKLLRAHANEDTIKLALLNKIAFAYTNSNFNKGTQIAEQAITLAKRLNAKKALADALLNKGINCLLSGKYDSVIALFENSLALYRSLQNNEGIAQSLRLIGGTYYQRSHHDTALRFDLEALRFAGYTNDRKLLGDVTNNIGNDYLALGNIPRAIDYYLKTLKHYEASQNKIGMGVVNGNIGNTYIAAKELEKGITHLQNAHGLFKEVGYKNGMSLAIHNAGVAYKELGYTRKSMADYKKAMDCFQESMAINKAIGSEGGVYGDVDNIGQLYIILEKYDSAMFYLKQSLRFCESQNIDGCVARNIGLLSNAILLASDRILLENGINPADRYKTALAYQHRAISLSKKGVDYSEQAEEWKNLSLIYEKQKRYDSALVAYQKFNELNNKALGLATNQEVTRKTLQYEFGKIQDSTKAANDRKEALAAANLKQQRTIKNAILIGAGFVFLSGLLLFFSYKRRRDAIAKKNEAELKAHIADTEMKVMRLQMNPHFIFNSLNSISDYIHKNNPQEADAYLSKFAKVMRMTLENSEQQAISLDEDLRTLELYMQLEAKRLSQKFTYEINIAPEIDKENTLVPPMIFQPFVENSIWHGISQKEGRGHIAINITKDGEMLHCLIDDDGVGRQTATSAESPRDQQSLGMKITRARIDILNKLKGSTASMQLIDKPQGLSASLKLPLQTAF